MTAPWAAADHAAMADAIGEARDAMLAGEVPVGAVVMFDDRVVARAQNRMRRDGDATSHAEVLVLRAAAAALGTSRLTGCTLYVTLEPCAMCAGAIVLSKIDRLVFGAWDDKAGMCGSLGDLVRNPRLNHSPAVVGGLCAEDSAAMLRDFFSSRRS